MKKIFISYSWDHDTKNANKLYNALMKFPKSFDVWMDKKKIDPGLQWKPAIRKAIRETDYFIAVLSSASVKKRRGTTNYEMYEAIEAYKEFSPTEVFLIPARVDKCISPFAVMAQFNYLDLFPNWSAGINKLITSLDQKLAGEKSKEVHNLKPGKKLPIQIAATQASFSSLPIRIRKVGSKINSFNLPKSVGYTLPLPVKGQNNVFTIKNNVVAEKVKVKPPLTYHYRVGLVDLDIELKTLKKMIAQLNKVQRYFLFTLPEMPPLKNKVQSIDGIKNFNISKVKTAYIKKNLHLETDFIACITKYPLAFVEDDLLHSNYFSSESNDDDRFLFLSTDQLKAFTKAAGIKYEEGILYILTSQLIAYFTDTNFHPATRGCMMDFCENRADIIKGFKARKLCPACATKLKKGDFKNAIDKLLKWKYN